MRIAHIVSSFPPYYGGMGNVVFQTAVKLEERGHEVVVLTPQYYEEKEVKAPREEVEEQHSYELEEQIENVRRLAPSFNYGNAARLPQLQKELDDFDLVHFHYPFFGTANIVRKWKLRNLDKPLVITYHMDPRGLGWKGLFFKLYARHYSHKILNIADKILASSFDYIESSEVANLLTDQKEKWIELPFGVDIDRFKPRGKDDALFVKYGFDENKPTLLFVGGMDRAHYFKGIPILLEALLILKKQGTTIQTILVGGGELQKEYELRVRAFGLGSFVKFAGRVSDEELPYYYNFSDLFVLPSIHQGEAFGMVLLEAMASGVPVIASDLPGVRTVASEGGILFEVSNSRDLAECIAGYFLNSEQDQQLWKQKVREIAEKKYAWEPIVSQLENVYKDLLK
jgi:glycosyltransferase involved in cell wall biosynthesis